MRGLWIYAAIGFVIAMLFPDGLEIMKSVTPALTQTIGRVIRSLPPLVKISSYPDVTAVYLSVMWCLLPIAIIWVFRSAPRPPAFIWSLKGVLLIIAAVPLLFVAGIWVPMFSAGWSVDDLSYVNGRGRAFITFFSKTRLGIGLVGGGVFMAFAIVAYALFVAFPTMLFVYPVQQKLMGDSNKRAEN